MAQNIDAVLHKKSVNNKITLMLDLDKTTLYGNDGNDLGVALQWMDKDEVTVGELYRNFGSLSTPISAACTTAMYNRVKRWMS